MSPEIDSHMPPSEMWETFDEEWAQSEFWTQVQFEADRIELVPPPNFQEPVQENEADWRIAETPEEEQEHKENIVHHDCMWAGSCADSVHPGNTFVPAEFAPAPGQSLLRRDHMSPPRPETPPSLDGDEPPQFRHSVDVAGTALRLLRDSAAVAADHSYTSRQQFDNLGVQTPSDSCESEEEIDVVSLGTSSSQETLVGSYVRTDVLPRSPSAQERHHIQHTVASAMTPRPVARKRLVPPANLAGPSNQQRRRARGPGRRGRRANTDTDSEGESPEIERRSMHNDMERLRRIGLKNLFDELKMQIPATRDKERAPKVVILREAAALCRKMRDENLQRDHLKKQQSKLIAKLKKLRKAMSVRYRAYSPE